MSEVMTAGVREELSESSPSSSISSPGRELEEESPEGRKDHRDFADRVKCPICGSEFVQDSRKPSDTLGDKSGHLKVLEHHAEEHPGEEFQGVKVVE
ncbi:MAG: hypothetical protein ABEK04_03420 [Candidatus Nanohalobium sp.]